MGKTLYAYDDRIWEPVYEFEYTGEPREFTIDPGEYLFICNGAQGGNGNTNSTYWCWNYGAAAYGIFETSQQETLYAVVGGEGGALNGSTPGEGGYNGGGRGGYYPNSSNAAGSGGGGASDIRLTLDEDLVVHPQRSDVPSEYEECWYMRRNWGDNGCFNTGYRMTNNTRVELDMKIHGFSVTNTSNGWAPICGQRSSDRSGDQFMVEARYNGNIGAGVCYPGVTPNSPKTPTGSNKIMPFDDRMTMTVTSTRVSWVTEYGETNSIDDIPPLTTNPAARDFVIFCYMNNNSYQYDSAFGLRIYECKIYEDDVLMHDFVPVIRKSDSVHGFFDTVNQEFKDIIGTLHAIRFEQPTKSLLSRILVAAGGGGDCNYTSNNQSYLKLNFGGGEMGSYIVSDREAKSSFGLWATQKDGPYERSFGRGRDGNVLSGNYGSYSQYGSGGGGGGWFGGTSIWNHSGSYASQPGAGGSSYALSSESYKPYGYIPTSHYYLKKTNLVPCQSEHNGSIKILKVAKLLHSEDKIIVPLQGEETKLRLYPGTYHVKCYGGEGDVYERGTGDAYRFNGGYSEGTLTLNNLHEIYGVVGGSGLWYDYRTYNQHPEMFNKYAGYNGGGKGVRTAGWSRTCTGGGATDLRLTMDQTPVHPTEPDPDTRDDIPEPYVQLKAIYMGNSYINSGYCINENTEIKVDVSISGNDGSYRELFGVEGALTFYTRASGQSAFVVDGDTIFGDLIPTGTRLTIETGNNWLKWTTDTSEYTYTSTARSVQSSSYQMYFNTMSRSGSTTDYALATWYGIKIYEDGVLIHDFVPVYRADLDLTGFYDVIGVMFAQVQGSDFSAVPLEETVYPSKTLMSRFIVAGGGGSRGYSSGYGGKGGGTTGGTQTNGNGVTGGPGTQTSSPSVPGHPESDGGFGYGGSGYIINNGRGGSGGGGWFGGSGSHPNGRNTDDIKGGNGGSGYILTEDSYKPEYYIPDEEFYLENASTTLGGNTLIPNMSRIEIDVVTAYCTKLMIYDSDGYKAFDVDSNSWNVISDTITSDMIEEYGIYQITSLTGIRNEFDVIMNDPDDVASGIAIDYDPLPQEISFLVPKRHYYNREVIDAVYDNTIYDMKTLFRKYDNEYNAYVVSVEKLDLTSDEIFKLYSINLFAN